MAYKNKSESMYNNPIKIKEHYQETQKIQNP